MSKGNRKFNKLGQIFLFCLVLLSLFACKKNDSSETYDTLLFSDDTTAAAQLVGDANEDLNKIKIKYNENIVKRAELTEALKNNDTAKVKQISDDLIDLINGGMVLAESAVEKIDKARDLNINPDFKEYLDLKADSLQKQMEAFKNYREAASFLRDKYDPKDEKQREAVKSKFEEVNLNFKKIIDSAKEKSKKANDLAKESAARNK